MTDLLLKAFIKTDNKNIEKYRLSCGKLAGGVGIVLNLILFAMKLIIGLLSGSVSIAADALNNLSDASSSIISLVGFKLSEQPADEEHPYGHGRYEYLSALLVSALIIVIGFELLKTGISRVINPESVKFSLPLLIILIASILVKLWMMLFNRKLSKEISSKTLEATAQDSRNDAISTLAVLLGAIISYFTPLMLDGFIGIGVAMFILISGVKLIKETADPVLGSAPDKEFTKAIQEKIMSYQGVLGTHDLLVHDYGPSRRFVSVHVEMAAEEDVLKSHDVIDNIESDFKKEGIHVIVHYDPVLTKDPITAQIREEVESIVKDIDSVLTIHDLRVVTGPTHTNVIFDCASPFNFRMNDTELRSEINKRVKQKHESYFCVIQIDKI